MNTHLLLPVLLGLGVAACGGGDTQDASTSAGGTTPVSTSDGTVVGAGGAGHGGSGVGGVTSGTSSAGPSTSAGSTSGGATTSTSGGATTSTSGGATSSTSGGATSGTSTSASSGGSTSATTGGGGTSDVYSQCRFHFGTTDGIAKNNASMIKELDFFTPGWMGQKDTFDMQYVCDYTKAGGTFAKQVPAIVAYVAAFYVKRHNNLKDCNAPGSQQDLCQVGAQDIKQSLAAIVQTYKSYAQGFASCYGKTRPIIFLMEPDFYQYTISNQGQPWTQAEAGQIMSQFVNTIKAELPNAVFSLDISPWVAPNNGQDNGKSWYSNFDMSLFTFINTSGGGTDAANTKIRSANNMTWAGVSQVTGKPIMADTGYGVNGGSAGPDANWDNVANINARMKDGVVSISQYNPASGWGGTIAGVRPQLSQPKVCP